MNVQHQVEIGLVLGCNVEISAKILEASLLGPFGECLGVLHRKSFPLCNDGNLYLRNGGASDYSDSHILDTALRETYEEMGVDPDDVDVLCRLDRVVTRSGFVITPFVGIIPSNYTFEISQIEVAEILEVPLDLLMNQYRRSMVTSAETGVYRYGEHVIWGATANILTQFLELL